MDRTEIVLAGVGGQGVLTAAKMLGNGAHRAGVEVVVGQLHGMSQRGGSVECSVLLGEGKSSFVTPGGAHVVAAFEPLEALRALSYVGRGTTVIVSRGIIVPFHMVASGAAYPPFEEVMTHLRGAAHRVLPVDGPGLVRRAGSARCLNVVMLGAVAALGVLPINRETLLRAVVGSSPERFAEANTRAFELGWEALRGSAAPQESDCLVDNGAVAIEPGSGASSTAD